jgi:hypothetical protein
VLSTRPFSTSHTYATIAAGVSLTRWLSPVADYLEGDEKS